VSIFTIERTLSLWLNNQRGRGTRILATPFFQTGDTVPGAFWHTNTMICKTLYNRTMTGAVRGWAKLDSSPVLPAISNLNLVLFAVKLWRLAPSPMAKLEFSISELLESLK